MTQQEIRVGYVNQIYPRLTETFVYREVLGLEREGLRLSTFANWRPENEPLSEEAKHLADSTFYTFPINRRRFLANHLHFLLKHPKKYLSTFFFVLSRPEQSFKDRLRTFYHFCEAVYLASDVKKECIQHMHAHFSINAATIAFVLARLLDISFSFTTHNNFFYDQLIFKEKIREARFIIVVSEYNRRFIAKLMPGEDHNHKIHTVHYGLSVNEFVPPVSKPQNHIPIILFVSQLAERKGTRYLIQACKLLNDRGVKFQCILLGDGPERTLLDDLVTKNDLSHQVKLKGAVYQEDLKNYLHQADIFALPCVTTRGGDADGIPNALMEAMATELPVISTYVSGVPELIEHEKTGLLVNEKDEVALADALQRLLEDRSLRLKLGKNGRQQIIQEFNIERNAQKLATLFRTYVDSQSNPVSHSSQQTRAEQLT